MRPELETLRTLSRAVVFGWDTLMVIKKPFYGNLAMRCQPMRSGTLGRSDTENRPTF